MRSIFKGNLLSVIDSILHTLISLILVFLFLTLSTEAVYMEFMKVFSLISLFLIPLNIWSNNLVSDLGRNDESYLVSLGAFKRTFYYGLFFFILIVLILYPHGLLPVIGAFSSYYVNTVVNVFDKVRSFRSKMIATLTAAACSGTSFALSSDMLLAFVIYISVKAIVYCAYLVPIGRRSSGNDYFTLSSFGSNTFYSLTTGFGDNFLRYTSTTLLAPHDFGFFDLLLRIFYSGRSLAGRLQYPILLELQENYSQLTFLKYLRLNIFISSGFFAGLFILEFFYTEFNLLEFNLGLKVFLSTAMLVNLMVSYSFAEMLKFKRYFILSLGGLSLPFIALILMFFNVHAYFILSISVLIQSLLIFYLFHRYNLNETSIKISCGTGL
jgi:hypothetical protein